MPTKIALQTFFFISFLLSSSALSADYYWVNNGGNWSDSLHWASSSGGPGGAYATAPTSADNVFFDANSFTAGSQLVTIDRNVECANVTFTGVTNTPSIVGNSGNKWEVNGNMTLVSNMNFNFLGNVDFIGSGTHSVTSAGKAFNQNVIFSGTGQWTLADAFNVVETISLESGSFDMAGMSVSCSTLDASATTNVRSIDFDNSAVTITGHGVVLDLTGNTTNLSVTTTGSIINFTNASNVTVNLGNVAKTVPNFIFSGCTGTCAINTGNTEDNTERITIGDITVLQDGAKLQIDENNDDSNVKTVGDITLPNDCRFIFGTADGTGAYGTASRPIISSITAGNELVGDLRGYRLEILGDVIFGEDADCDFRSSTQFSGDLSFNTTGGNGIIFNNNFRLDGNMAINGDCDIRFDGTSDINGNITIADNASVIFDHNTNNCNIDISGTLELGQGSKLDMGEGSVGPINISNINLDEQAQLHFTNGSSSTSVNNISIGDFSTVKFNANGTCSISGTITSTGDCSSWIWLKSTVDGTPASVSFSSAQTLGYAICHDINCTSSNVTNNNGVDLGSNSGISFATPTTGVTLYWVGGTSGNTKTGSFSTGTNNNWSNPDNWSTTSGVYTGSNGCIPGVHDNVVFDANSFSAGTSDVNMDLNVLSCNDMSWSAVPSGFILDGNTNDVDRELYIYGNLQFHSNIDNQFEGTTIFSALDGTTRNIDPDGSNFFGNVTFDRNGGSWSLSDDMDMNGGNRADLTIENGTFDANGSNINLEDDWIVRNGATFSANNGAVRFDGPSSQNSYQEITTNGNAFYNLEIQRTNGGGREDIVRLTDEITVSNNLNIISGRLEDRGNQITGNATGSLSMGNGSYLVLSYNATATEFPTLYTALNISLHKNCRVYYNAKSNQTISHVPAYGRLYLSNTNNGTLMDKELTGPITVNHLLHINDDNNLIDNGHQITGVSGREIQMDPRSKLTLGTASSATSFPLNFTNIDIRQPSEIVYNSGVNQTIKSINGTGNARYDNLTITNAAGTGTPVKSLEGDISVRSDITINADNTFDADASGNYNISLRGNWINDGAFNERSGTVALQGSSAQSISNASGREDFYNITFNNLGSGVTINTDIYIGNNGTFTHGIVYEGSGSEFVVFESGSSVSGASDASHVDGRVEKIGSDAFVFPVGDLGVYQAIAISAPSTAGTTFRAEYFNHNPASSYDDTQLDPTINHVSDCEYWILDQITPFADAVYVTLHYKAHTGACSGVTNPADLVVSRWDGTTWRDHGGPGTGAPSGSVTSSAPISSFSPFTLASISSINPLPVELLSFDAIRNENNVDLTWVTASEINNDYFVVEKSSDGENFKPVLKTDGAGNSTSTIEYFDIDYDPYPGVSYYRLKQVDYDGQFTYSNIVPVRFESKTDKQNISAYPNPVSYNASHINLSLEGFDGVEILVVLRDIAGKEYYSKVEIVKSGSVVKAIPISEEIAPGIYLVIASSNESIHSKKIVIQ